jgi:hypothetical protein
MSAAHAHSASNPAVVCCILTPDMHRALQYAPVAAHWLGEAVTAVLWAVTLRLRALGLLDDCQLYQLHVAQEGEAKCSLWAGGGQFSKFMSSPAHRTPCAESAAL